MKHWPDIAVARQLPEHLPADASVSGRATPYAWYLLGVMVIVYAFSLIDRQILSILVEPVKRDLKITDADLGFLYGTAFAIFYTLFGIPLGRLADNWRRVHLMALGLLLWSSMTILSGLASSFAMLAVARIGVGIGEASASPAAYSMLADGFPKHRRALAISIYTVGGYLGIGLSLPIGGLLAESWANAFPPDGAPLNLQEWQAAFVGVGLPGLLLVRGWEACANPPAKRLTGDNCRQCGGAPGECLRWISCRSCLHSRC